MSSILAWLWANKAELLALLLAVIGAASVLVKALEMLVSALVVQFPQLKGVDGALQGIAAFLDRLAKSGFLNSVAFNRKAVAFLLPLLAVGFLTASSARAGGWDYAVGPTLPMLEYDIGSATPVQLAPGAGVQVSLTNEALQKPLFGKLYDLLDLDAMAFGSVVTAGSGQQFGALSVAGAVCTLSSLFCVGVGTHVLSGAQALAPGRPFLLLALSFNVAMTPTAPTSFDSARWGFLRGNTLYFGGP